MASAATEQLQDATLDALARIIRADWRLPSHRAKPYLDAMQCIGSVQDAYGADSGKTVVLYFLNNARGWRGDTARAVKRELRRRVGL